MVCRKFEVSRRRDVLSFEHHAEVASTHWSIFSSCWLPSTWIVATTFSVSIPIYPIFAGSNWLYLSQSHPLIAALMGWCPAYGALGKTCPTEDPR
jgi:hypothetical protein